MFDKINDWFVHQFGFKKQAKNIVKWYTYGYSVGKAERPDLSDREILITLALADDDVFGDYTFNETFASSRKILDECCQTINGACYLRALWGDMVAGLWLWRSEQMANLIDKELKSRGFPLQSQEQKTSILDAMGKFKFPSK